MIKLHLSDMEDYELHNIVVYRNERTLYEYFVEMPLDDLRAYPKRGYRLWMGRKARSKEALDLRDYVLFWRLYALDFREKYSLQHLQSLSIAQREDFLNTYLRSVPVWAHEKPLQDVVHLLRN